MDSVVFSLYPSKEFYDFSGWTFPEICVLVRYNPIPSVKRQPVVARRSKCHCVKMSTGLNGRRTDIIKGIHLTLAQTKEIENYDCYVGSYVCKVPARIGFWRKRRVGNCGSSNQRPPHYDSGDQQPRPSVVDETPTPQQTNDIHTRASTLRIPSYYSTIFKM